MSTVTQPRPPVQPGRPPVKPAAGRARLAIHINATEYTVRPLDAPEDFGYSLRKPDGTVYNVVLEDHGRRSCYTCDCPDYILRRAGRDPAGCKHIKAMIAVGLLDAEGGAR